MQYKSLPLLKPPKSFINTMLSWSLLLKWKWNIYEYIIEDMMVMEADHHHFWSILTCIPFWYPCDFQPIPKVLGVRFIFPINVVMVVEDDMYLATNCDHREAFWQLVPTTGMSQIVSNLHNAPLCILLTGEWIPLSTPNFKFFRPTVVKCDQN